MSNDAKQRAAREAHQRAICDSSVFIVVNGSIASGPIFETPKGLPFVLTARHVAEDLRAHQPMIGRLRSGDAKRSSIQAIAFGPERPSLYRDDGKEDDVDVAAFLPSSGCACLKDAPRLNLSRIPQDFMQKESDVILLTGYPTFLVAPNPTDRFDREVSYISYTTGIVGRDKYGRLKVNWENAIRDASSPAPEHLQMPVGQVMKLGAPRGISGGGLWRLFGPPSPDEVWTPQKFSELIGVPCSWDNGIVEYVEPSEFWREWLHATASAFDAKFSELT